MIIESSGIVIRAGLIPEESICCSNARPDIFALVSLIE